MTKPIFILTLAAALIAPLVVAVVVNQSRESETREAETKALKAEMEKFDRDAAEAKGKIIRDSDAEILKDGRYPTCDHCGGKVNHFKKVCQHCGRDRW